LCPTVRRVLIVERAVQVPVQDAGCTRRDMGGIFVVKSISSLVVDVGGPSPTLLLRQGRVSLDPPRVWKPAPTGLVLFGGGAFTSGGNVTAIACGDVAGCSGDQAGLGYSAGAAYWLTPFLAAEGTYIKAADATAAGRTDTFEFESVFEVEVLTLVGKVGIPRGPVRPYGLAGATYQQSTFRTSQTMLGAETPNTLSYQTRTDGWGFVFGGGVEMWFSSVFGVYGEYGNAGIKGTSRDHDDGSGSVDARMHSVLFGARLRVGGW
jgi:Outer membrane protein beta-barrel domain